MLQIRRTKTEEISLRGDVLFSGREHCHLCDSRLREFAYCGGDGKSVTNYQKLNR